MRGSVRSCSPSRRRPGAAALPPPPVPTRGAERAELAKAPCVKAPDGKTINVISGSARAERSPS